MDKLKSTLIWSLVWVNVALLVGWAFKLTSPAAQAQFRSKGSYLMIPGAIQSGSGSAIYILNTDSGALGAIFFNESLGRMEQMRPLDLNSEFQRMAGGH
jgi:hypothetical protein